MLKIVDDFLSDPNKIRNLVLEQQFYRMKNVNYPGKTCLLPDFPNAQLYTRIADLIGSSFFWQYNVCGGAFRLSTIDNTSGSYVHIDQCDITGILYLTPDAPVNSGTSFFKHRELGITSLYPEDHPLMQSISARLGLPPNRIHRITSQDSKNLGKWEEIERVENRYNRLVLMDPTSFHAHTKQFGSNKETGRLTLNFFLHTFEGYQWSRNW